MDEYIKLADGTIVQNAYVVKMGSEQIAIYVKGVHTFYEMYGWFGNSGRTERITAMQYGDVSVWDGYTTPITLQVDERESYVTLVK